MATTPEPPPERWRIVQARLSDWPAADPEEVRRAIERAQREGLPVEDLDGIYCGVGRFRAPVTLMFGRRGLGPYCAVTATSCTRWADPNAEGPGDRRG